MRHLLLITNPAAQGVTDGRRHRVAGRLEAAFRLEQVETKGPGHATEIVRSFLPSGLDVVVVCGGDGTISEVACGLAGSGVPLAILPGGTSNVLARELAIPLDLDQATADCQPLRPCSEEGHDDARPDDRRCRVHPGAPRGDG